MRPTKVFVSAFLLLANSSLSDGFMTMTKNRNRLNRQTTATICLYESSEPQEKIQEFFDNLGDNIKTKWNIFQESKQAGYDTKIGLACALAGDDYDKDATKAEVQQLIDSAPCVMFSWKNSPSCKKAVEALNKAGVQYKIVPLDDPFDRGNELRAELAKMVGRSSVPAIFIGGEYVGGFDGGVSDEAPGIVDMAFQGTLRPKLEKVGALVSSDIPIFEEPSPIPVEVSSAIQQEEVAKSTTDQE